MTAEFPGVCSACQAAPRPGYAPPGRVPDWARRLTAVEPAAAAQAILEGRAPSRLRVNGTLDLSRNSDLRRLPDELRVEGSLFLSDCALLESLGRNLSVAGQMDISGCLSLKRLPPGLQVGQSVTAGGRTPLVAIPPGVRIGGSADVSGSRSLVEISEDVEVGGCFYLYGCSALKSLPRRLRVGGLLDAGGCAALERLPEILGVPWEAAPGGWVKPRLARAAAAGLRRLAALGSPAARLTSSGGSVKLAGCSSLKELPAAMAVDGDLSAAGLKALRRLPHILMVRGNADLSGLAQLSALPRMLWVGGSLNLAGCAQIRELPKGLFVGGTLDISGTGVRAMPRPHRVRAYLLRGVAVPPKVYWNPERLTFLDIMGLDSLEVRRIALERLGMELFLQRTFGHAVIVDKDPNERVGTLYRIALPGEPEPVCLLRVLDGTLPKHYVLRVPPACATAREANAWTWGLEAEQYVPEQEA